MEQKQNTAARRRMLLLCGLLGAAAFLLVYGLTPLDPTQDAWLLAGYDEQDIDQHYAGWLAFRNSPWSFPLGYASALSTPDGIMVTYTDSIPWVAILFKLLRGLLPQTWQYFGLYTLLCFVLQGVGGGLLLDRFGCSRPLVWVGAGFFVTAPILLERAFRHTALGSQWLILFAAYLYLRHRDRLLADPPPGRAWQLPWQFLLLNGLAVGIHPYLVPMVLLFTLLSCLEQLWRGRRFGWRNTLSALGLLAANGLTVLAAGLCLGVFGGQGSMTREGFGLYSMNLNAAWNPSSIFGYRWSQFLPALPQNLEQYEGFCYMGLGFLLLLALAALGLLAGARRAAPVQWLGRNGLLLAACLGLTLFALSNRITLGTHSVTIPLPQWLLALCGIFRSSGRMFYPVWYLLLTAALAVLARRLGPRRSTLLAGLLLAVQLADLSGVILQKHSGMLAAADGSGASPLFTAEELADLGRDHTALQLTNNIQAERRDLAVLAGKQGMTSNAVIATGGGDYAGAWESMMVTAAAEAESGTPDPQSVYVTDDAGRWQTWQDLYEGDTSVRLCQIGTLYFLIPA